MIKDVIVEEVRRVRAELIQRYGGLSGWIDHLQEMDQQRLLKSKKRTAKKAAAKKPTTAKTTPKRRAKPKP